MNKKFIYCFTKSAKEELTANGFKFICEQDMGDQIAYIFNNECDKLNFTLDNGIYIFHNMLFFS